MAKPRTKSLIIDEDLEPLHNFGQFPVYLGCTDDEEDRFAEMSFSIGKTTGVIQLDHPADLNLVYKHQHNDGVGKIWDSHYKEFAKFVAGYEADNYFEIGGSHDKIARHVIDSKDVNSWIIVDPNPLAKSDDKVMVLHKWFTENDNIPRNTDIVVHSHLIEHLYDPKAFLEQISASIGNGIQIFSIPNMKKMLQHKFSNCLNFEHTVFLSEGILEYLLASSGFEIIEKRYFLEHSIFYSTRKKEIKDIKIPNEYEENKNLFLDFVDSGKTFVSKCNSQLTENTYIFGAHIFSQFLFSMGLNSAGIKAILDESPLKIGKRLYGTDIKVYSPELLKDISNPTVILSTGYYADQIAANLMTINKNIKLIRMDHE